MDRTNTTAADQANMIHSLSNVKGDELCDELCQVVKNLSDKLLLDLAEIDCLAGEYAQAIAFERGYGSVLAAA